jgi:hypothetical protein
MITFSKLGQKGRLGNALFQIASTIGMAIKYGHEYAFPHWEFSDYFESFKSAAPDKSFTVLKEKTYTAQNWDLLPGQNYDLDGWLQTAKYWEHSEESRKAVLSTFTFKPEIIEDLKQRYPAYETAICISIRRGDFVGNSNYYQLSMLYYILALFEKFPDWQERKLYIFSDDLDYCRHHFQSLPNVVFIEEPPIIQLALGPLCRNFIISNSTFSWWLAYLAGPEATVIRPIKNLAGKLALLNSEADYWQSDWIIFDHENKKIPAEDVTFTCPLFYDHSDRKNNANLSVCLLQRYFNTNIIIGEQGSQVFGYFSKWCKYMLFDKMGHFHRTKMLNDMCYEAKTPFIVNWDIDTVLPPLQIWSAINALREGADISYPFDGRVYHVPRIPNFQDLEKSLDTGIFGTNNFRGKNGVEIISSVGHAVFANKESYINAGLENEKMISYGPEDCERYDRFKALGLSIVKIPAPMLHIEHFRGRNSTGTNPFFKQNTALLDKQRQLTPEQLRAEVDNWPWVKKYTEAYYHKIAPGAIESAKEVAKALNLKPQSVIDIGCGLGEWSKGFPDALYVGVDKGVQRRALLFPEKNYFDYDLNKMTGPASFTDTRYSLALCLEVAEHINASKALKLVELLCSLSDMVLFSAAIPGQGGHGHVNEQWQPYWADMFAKFGHYQAKKQPDIRDNDKIEVWYKQNIVLYSKGAKGGKPVERYVHPDMWLNHFANKK